MVTIKYKTTQSSYWWHVAFIYCVPFSIAYIIDQSISSSFFATTETAYILVSPLWKKVLPWYNNCCRSTAVISRRVFLWKISQSIGGTVNTLRNDTPLMWKPWYLQKMIRIKLAWRNLQFISNVLLYIHFVFCFDQSILIGHINHPFYRNIISNFK